MNEAGDEEDVTDRFARLEERLRTQEVLLNQSMIAISNSTKALVEVANYSAMGPLATDRAGQFEVVLKRLTETAEATSQLVRLVVDKTHERQ